MSISRRTLLLSTLGVVAVSRSAVASEPFTTQAFAAAQAAGKAILVEVHADWCPVCQRQRPILSGLAAQPDFAGLVRLVVDFDAQKDVLRTLRVTQQSTLIAYRGATERGRSVGDTNAASIQALVRSSLS